MSEARRIERVAIDHHHEMADVFNEFYAQDDRFANAFKYGRHKIDVLLDAEIKRLPPGASILDAGCGTGHYVARLREQGFDARGMEPAPAMREIATSLNGPEIISDGVITALPYEDASFDLVLSIEVFRYLAREDNLQGLSEVMRVLKPGGVAFITFVNRYATDGFYLFQRLRQLRRGRLYDNHHPHCEFTTPAEIARDLRDAGASEVRAVGRLWGGMRVLYKLNEGLGAQVARRIEAYEDIAHESSLLAPFAGHLIAIATKRG